MRWRGYGPSHATWEPVSSFVRRNHTRFIDYVCKRKTKVKLFDLEALTLAIEALSGRSCPELCPKWAD